MRGSRLLDEDKLVLGWIETFTMEKGKPSERRSFFKYLKNCHWKKKIVSSSEYLLKAKEKRPRLGRDLGFV